MQKLFAVRLRNCTAAAVRSGRTAAICALFPGTPVIPRRRRERGGIRFLGIAVRARRNRCRKRSLARKLGVGFADAGARGVEPAFDGVHFSGAGHRLFARACFRPWRNASAQGLRREEGRNRRSLGGKSEAEAGQPAESRLQSIEPRARDL